MNCLIDDHGEWHSTTIFNFLIGNSCNICHKGGYNPLVQGTFYIQQLSNNNDVYYKFGITNKTASHRKSNQEKVSIYEHTVIHEEKINDGYIPLIIENEIKKCGD